MNIVVLDAATLGADIDLSPISALGDVAVYASTAEDMVAARVAEADVVVVNKLKMNEKTLNGARNLKLICVTATGYDNVDTAYCRAKGIALCNVPAYSTESVAQTTLAMALSLATGLFSYRRYVADGRYTASGVANCLTPVYHEISTLTWGVVGGGGIGRRVARMAKALGCRVLLCRRSAETEFESADIDTLCRESDIISLHVPLNDSTRGMINADRIATMKKGAILINGTDIQQIGPQQLAQQVAFVTTERIRIANLSCRDVVALGRAPYTNWIGRMQPEDETIVMQSLEKVGMDSYAFRTMDKMSDGECQRVMIARALAQQTPIILLDEPTSFLDMPNRYDLCRLLADLAHEDNKCIIFSTHELDIAQSLCDTIALIDSPTMHHLSTPEMIRSGHIEKLFKVSR